MNVHITIYSTMTCPYCKMLKDYLESKNIQYEEKMVDNDEAAKEEMMKESGGFLGVPYTVIVKEGGEKDTVIGFDQGKLDQILGL